MFRMFFCVCMLPKGSRLVPKCGKINAIIVITSGKSRPSDKGRAWVTNLNRNVLPSARRQDCEDAADPSFFKGWTQHMILPKCTAGWLIHQMQKHVTGTGLIYHIRPTRQCSSIMGAEMAPRFRPMFEGIILFHGLEKS